MRITGCKTFSASKPGDREKLGKMVTEWRRERPELTIIDTFVNQSSDAQYHCLSMTIFYEERTRRTK